MHGKQRLLAIGIYPVISLVEARRIRENSKRDLAAGIDPSQRKRTEKLQLASGITTFQSVAEEDVAKQQREGRASNTIDKIEWLLSFAYPHIGRSTLKQISSADVLTVLQKLSNAAALIRLVGCGQQSAAFLSLVSRPLEPTTIPQSLFKVP